VTKELITFLDANGLGDYGQSKHIEEGAPFEVISSTVKQLGSDRIRRKRLVSEFQLLRAQSQ